MVENSVYLHAGSGLRATYYNKIGLIEESFSTAYYIDFIIE